MESCTVSGYEVIVCEPAAQSSRVGVLLNDGEIAEKLSSMCEDVWLFGVVPRDRLNDYTPWPAAAMRKGAPDFGGGCESYTGHLTEGVLPLLSEKYGIGKWIYGGHSLGGLAAVYSLYCTDAFQAVFSVCGSFWYPGFLDFLSETRPVNTGAQVYLLNGAAEGAKHDNRLAKAPLFAAGAHDRIASAFLHTQAGFDPYGHHEHVTERLLNALNWCKSQI